LPALRQKRVSFGASSAQKLQTINTGLAGFPTLEIFGVGVLRATGPSVTFVSYYLLESQ